ncbi:MAG: hypothetical protein M0Q88_02915 [Bacilli bacterium]|nr:hypothetical protein [Bacilli bacterium]
MNRSYNPMIDNGLFVAEYYLNVPYNDITIDLLLANLRLFSDKIGNLIDTKEFYRKITYLTHVNSSFTQIPNKKTKETMISDQFKELIDNMGNDKNCIYCGEKQVNIDLNIDRKFIYGLVSQTFFNSSNNLQTVDICPVCALLSMLSILNIQKIGMPTLYISDSDQFMRNITKDIQEILLGEKDIESKLDIESNLKARKLVELALNSPSDVGYITQFCFQNAGQIVKDIERNLFRKDIDLLLKLKDENLLDEFISFGFHNRLVFNVPLITEIVYCSPELFKILGGYELNDKEKRIVDYVTESLLEIESVEKILRDLKLCNNRNKFNEFILTYSEKRALVKDVKDYDILTGFNWYKFRDYINMNILIYKTKEV